MDERCGPPPLVGIVSDDLTGANGVAAMFAARGMQARTVLHPAADSCLLQDAQVIVVDSATRDASRHAAYASVREAADPAMLRGIAAEVLGRPVSLGEEALAGALDPVENVARRSLPGGPAPAEVARMAKERRATLRSARERAARRRDRDRRAHELLARSEATITATDR